MGGGIFQVGETAYHDRNGTPHHATFGENKGVFHYLGELPLK